MLDDYLELYREKVAGYEGAYKDLIESGPDMLKLLDELLSHEDIIKEHRQHITATIAYFVAPYDVLSEHIYGYIGYLDDLYLASYTLKRIMRDIEPSVLEGFWEGERDLVTVVDEVHDIAADLLGSKTHEVLEYVGLQ